eukprot:490697-Pelagomonas_calceolata.AAC.1
MIKIEYTPTGWNCSKLRLEHAPPNPSSSNGANALSRPAHTDSRTNSSPLFETRDMELEHPLFQSQDNPPPDDQMQTEAQDTQETYLKKTYILY